MPIFIVVGNIGHFRLSPNDSFFALRIMAVKGDPTDQSQQVSVTQELCPPQYVFQTVPPGSILGAIIIQHFDLWYLLYWQHNTVHALCKLYTCLCLTRRNISLTGQSNSVVSKLCVWSSRNCLEVNSAIITVRKCNFLSTQQELCCVILYLICSYGIAI